MKAEEMTARKTSINWVKHVESNHSWQSPNARTSDLEQRITELEALVKQRYVGPVVKNPPIRPYTQIVKDSQDPGYINRLLIGTATTGNLRVEWVQARYGQIVPTNWSHVQYLHYMNAFMTLRHQVADAQNMIVKAAVEGDYEWLLLYEHDVLPPADAFKRLNDYMIEAQWPVISGLYYTRSRPSEPLVYRGRGTGYYADWQFGDRVLVDGVPTGFLLIHMGIIRAMWDNAKDYIIQHPDGRQEQLKMIFDAPRQQWLDPDTGQYNTITGTSDLAWCSDIINGGYLAKAGWYEHQEMEYPFLIDTELFCRHINPDGEQFP